MAMLLGESLTKKVNKGRSGFIKQPEVSEEEKDK